MASSTYYLLLPLPHLLALLFLLYANPAVGCFNSIFSFGDSLADTGNFLTFAKDSNIGRLPYGETYFHRPTGRFSDGRIVIDFIAQRLGLPLVPPYLVGPGGQGFRQGANFAVGGATALPNDFFKAKGLNITWTQYSLGIQIEQFKNLLPSLCSSDSAQAIGVPFVPPYLAGPGDHGFRRGANFAVGGATALENDFFRSKGLNVNWTEYSLGTQIEWFKQLLPSLCSSDSGFEKPFDACCGGGGPSGCSIPCGDPGFTVCSDPSKYVSWDGLHLTEAAYRAIARGLLKGSYTTPSMNRACPHIEQYAANLRNDSSRTPVQTYSAVL
ncbi:putative GDSL esterase/lipase [Cocos nucifera]|uniref:Putative GDSL esterase/lipase n=1 Tax=Cocos nucifera TaxID=13894 RepID=A0A8K0IAR1_COCNU|nr:putative GDSL esterase/lipase [Cocos nucifera]